MTATGWHSQGEAHLPPTDDWLTEPERGRLAAMPYTKRRQESRLGRWTAKGAVALGLGWEGDPGLLRRITIRNAPDGAPEVLVDGRPGRLRISMTDRAGWAVALTSDGDEVGCDLELVEPRSPAFVRDYLTPAEQRLVAGSAAPELAANLIWSAKESALKVLRTGLRRDTRSVEVRLDGQGAGGWEPLTVTAVEGRVFSGWWRRFGPFVLTVAAAAERPPPAPLTEPPPLAGAVPAHTWMARPLAPPP